MPLKNDINASEYEVALKSVLKAEKLDDILIVGYTERDGSELRFHPMLWWIYLKFTSHVLLLSSVNQWFLKLTIVDDIKPQFDVEESEFCIASIRDALVFNSHLDIRIKAFQFLLDEQSDIKSGTIKLGGVYLTNGDTIFFDPTSNEGIRIGTKEQVYRWNSYLHYPCEKYTEVIWNFD